MDNMYMAQALRLAERGLCTTHPNPRVGCVIVKNAQVIGEGWHQYAGGHHAEIHALQQAGASAEGATVYVTLEPCAHHGRTPPCCEALVNAKVAKVMVAIKDPNPQVAGQGIDYLRAAGIDVNVGLLSEQAAQLNTGFFMRMSQRRPWVRCKMAMSLDGRTAMASGESQWITSADARLDVHRLRAQSSAIVTGIGTVLADNPALTARLSQNEQQQLNIDERWQQPLRVVLDPDFRIPSDAKIMQQTGRTIVCTSIKHSITPMEKENVDVVVLLGDEKTLELSSVLTYLAQHEHINDVLLETGATLSGAMLAAGLIDEIILYVAPHIMGNQARGLFHLPALNVMQDRIHLNILDIRAIGQNWRITAKPEKLS